MREVDRLKVDRTVLTTTTLAEAGHDLNYWLAQPPIKRLEGIELMRQAMYHYDPDTTRLSRVLTIIEPASG